MDARAAGLPMLPSLPPRRPRRPAPPCRVSLHQRTRTCSPRLVLSRAAMLGPSPEACPIPPRRLTDLPRPAAPPRSASPNQVSKNLDACVP